MDCKNYYYSGGMEMSDSERIEKYFDILYPDSILSLRMIDNAQEFLAAYPFFGPTVDYPVYSPGDEVDGSGEALGVGDN
jgi:hypothetical protein